MYDATGDTSYRDWSSKTLLWLDTILWDPSRQLYRWSVAFEDLPHRTGAVIHQRYFNYDQSIAIEAQLAADRVAQAEAIGHATQAAFWSQSLGGYNLEAGVDQVFTSYGAWTSLGELALYKADADPSWLEMATTNLSGLNDRLRESDGGYAYRDYRCVDRVAKGCESGQVNVVVDHTRDTSAQSWTQHLATALAQTMSVPAVALPGSPAS